MTIVYALEATFTDATVTGYVQTDPINWNLDIDFLNFEDKHFQPGTGTPFPNGCLLSFQHCYHGEITPTFIHLIRDGEGSTAGAVILNLDRSGAVDFSGGYLQWSIGDLGGDFVSGTLVARPDLPPLPVIPEPSSMLAISLMLLFMFLKKTASPKGE